MKCLIIILTAFALHSCTHTNSEKGCYMDIYVIRDITDFHVLKPEANSILGLYDLSKHKGVEVNFRYREISDKVLMPAVNLRLPDKSVTDRENRKNEALYREKLILNFYDIVRKTLITGHLENDSSFLDNSECFKTISSELNLLVQSNSENKILLVFSNLFENSAIISVYRDKNRLIQSPSKIRDRFERCHLLPENLKGIKVFFVFQPVTREEDFQYLKMIDVYKELLEPRGAIVKVQANNDYLN